MKLRVPALIACVAVLAAGCGEGTNGLSADERASYEPRAETMGVALDFIYLTEVSGYEHAPMGSGPFGDDAFQTVYVGDAGTLYLVTDDTTMTTETCPQVSVPLSDTGSEAVHCESSGDGLYRTQGQQHEYAAEKNGLLIRASGPTAIELAVLKEAVGNARPATAAELDAILPQCESDCVVERGDIPEDGDGAPIQETGEGG